MSLDKIYVNEVSNEKHALAISKYGDESIVKFVLKTTTSSDGLIVAGSLMALLGIPPELTINEVREIYIKGALSDES